MAETSQHITEALQGDIRSLSVYFEACQVQDLIVSILCFISSSDEERVCHSASELFSGRVPSYQTAFSQS